MSDVELTDELKQLFTQMHEHAEKLRALGPGCTSRCQFSGEMHARSCVGPAGHADGNPDEYHTAGFDRWNGPTDFSGGARWYDQEAVLDGDGRAIGIRTNRAAWYMSVGGERIAFDATKVRAVPVGG